MNRIVQGIVIKETDFADNHKYITIATKQGKIEVLARSVRRKGNRLLPQTRLFSFAEFELFESKSGFRLNSASPVASFFDITKDVSAYALACYFAQLTGTVMENSHENEDVFLIFVHALHALAKGKRSLPLLKAAFELKLMERIGLMPRFDVCLSCEETSAPLWFLPGAGGSVCETCLPGSLFAQRGAVRMTPGIADAMAFVFGASPSRYFSFAVGEETQQALGALSEDYVLEQVPEPLPTLSFYHSCLRKEEPSGE